MKKTYLITILIFIIIFGCKKYEEGPLLSLRSKTQRLMGGYELEKYSIDEIDLTYLLKNKEKCFGVAIYKYSKGRGEKIFFEMQSSYNSQSLFDYSGWYEFENNKKNILWHFSPDLNDSTDFFLKNVEEIDESSRKVLSWDIKRLTNDKLIIEANTNGFKHRFELNKSQY